MDFPDFPDHVLFNINVAVVAMILGKTYGYEFEQADDTKSKMKSDEMWEMTEQLHDVLIECLGTDDSILDFINWFFDGIRKTFETESNLASKNASRTASLFSLQHQQLILVFPDTCFQCRKPYTSSTPQDKWCKACESHVFESKFHTWTSGNVELDRFIRQTQQEATDSTGFLRWIPFSAFTDLNQIGKGGFSEVYSGKYTRDRLDGTLKQWVTNMEYQIILDYLRYRSEENLEEISQVNWEGMLTEFATRMRKIYRNRKVLKCKPRESPEENSETKVKRNNSFTRLKNLLKRRPGKKKNKNRLLATSKSNQPIIDSPTTKIIQVPTTVSPLRNNFIPKTVALKRLVDSRNLSSNFIREMKAHYLALKKSSKFPRMYGITQDPQTKDYYIVLQYANDLDLHRYLSQNCATIDWWQRISILDGIVKGIYEVHKADLIHHNLHTGNILIRRTRRKETERINWRITSPSVKIWISDSGLWGPAGSFSSGNNNPNLIGGPSQLTSGAASIGGNSIRNSIPSISPAHSMINMRKGIYGILPYIAPEILQGKEYTKSSDIYGLGIIMWELSNSATLGKKQRHRQPFHDQPFDINLATDIVVNGKRPNIDEHAALLIPDCWLDLMKKCWASNPEDRPNIEDIMKITGMWNMERRKSLNLGSGSSLVFSLSQENIDDENIVGQFIEAEKRRVEKLNKGKQVEKDNGPYENESTENKFREILFEDDEIHPEASMKSRLIDFVAEISSSNNNDENLEIIYEDSNPFFLKEKVDSGFQQPRDYESLEQKEVEDESGSEKTIEKEKDSNNYVKEKPYLVINEITEPDLIQEDKTKRVKLNDNQIEAKQDNQDSPIRNGIEANSETGSKETTITKEKEP